MILRSAGLGVGKLMPWLFVALATSRMSSSGQAATLSVHVIDYDTGLAVSGALVRITAADTNREYRRYTSSRGRASFVLPTSGRHIIHVTAVGYAAVESGEYIYGGSRNRVRIVSHC